MMQWVWQFTRSGRRWVVSRVRRNTDGWVPVPGVVAYTETPEPIIIQGTRVADWRWP